MDREESSDRSKAAPGEPGPARLYALLAGAFLSLLGVAGFFYDAGFDTGSGLASDYLAGTLLINGWRNVIYLLSGLLALGFAARVPRTTALVLGGFYLVLAIWGFAETEHGIGSILDALPLGDRDNALHLVLGVLGLGAVLAEGPMPKVKLPKRKKRKKRAKRAKPKRPTKPKSTGPAAEASRDPAEPDAKRRIPPELSKAGRGDRRPSRAAPRPGGDA